MKAIVITIYFVGLISHIGDVGTPEEKTYSAILNAVLHDAEVAWKEPATGADGKDTIQLKDAFHLTASGAKTTTDADFREGVPSLQALTFLKGKPAELDPGVGKDHASVRAYVILPGGSLGVHTWYNSLGVYYLDKTILRESCTAKVTKLTVTYPAGTQKVEFWRGKLKANKHVAKDADAIQNDAAPLHTFTSDGEIIISNTPDVLHQPGVDRPLGRHGKMHYGLTVHDKAAKLAQGEECKRAAATAAEQAAAIHALQDPHLGSASAKVPVWRAKIFTPTEIECSNSSFP